MADEWLILGEIIVISFWIIYHLDSLRRDVRSLNSQDELNELRKITNKLDDIHREIANKLGRIDKTLDKILDNANH